MNRKQEIQEKRAEVAVQENEIEFIIVEKLALLNFQSNDELQKLSQFLFPKFDGLDDIINVKLKYETEMQIFSRTALKSRNQSSKSLKSRTFCCSGHFNCFLKSTCSNYSSKSISRLLFPIRFFYPISPIIAENINRLQVNRMFEFRRRAGLDQGLHGMQCF